MKPGDRAMIYEDPITQEKEEGMATLIEDQGCDPGDCRLEHWLVVFDEDGAHGSSYRRAIFRDGSIQPKGT